LEDLLAVLVLGNAVEVRVEEVGTVEGAALGFGMELGREDGARFVDHSFIAGVIEIDEVRPPVRWKGRSINGVTVVLAGDMAASSGQVESWDVVSSVTILELNGAGTSRKSQELMTETDAEDGDLRGFHQLAEVIHGFLTMRWIPRSIGDEDAVEMVSNFVDWVVVWECSDACTAADEATEDVLLDTAVNDSDVIIPEAGVDMEGCLGANFADEVDLFRVNEGRILLLVIFLANGYLRERRTLFTEVCDNGTGVNPSYGRDALPSTPLGQTLYSSPMAVLFGHICDNDTAGLNIR